MKKAQSIQLFESKKVRSVWDSEQEIWYFSIVDVCNILTEQPDYDHAKNYWKVLKHRLIKEGNELVTNCNQLKMVSHRDGKGKQNGKVCHCFNKGQRPSVTGRK